MTTTVLPEAYSSDGFPTVTRVVCYVRFNTWNSLLSYIEQSIGADVYRRKDGSKIFSISFPVGKKFAYELSYILAWEMKNGDINITLYLVEDKVFVVGKEV
jgi:hypothetical protein